MTVQPRLPFPHGQTNRAGLCHCVSATVQSRRRRRTAWDGSLSLPLPQTVQHSLRPVSQCLCLTSSAGAGLATARCIATASRRTARRLRRRRARRIEEHVNHGGDRTRWQEVELAVGGGPPAGSARPESSARRFSVSGRLAASGVPPWPRCASPLRLPCHVNQGFELSRGGRLSLPLSLPPPPPPPLPPSPLYGFEPSRRESP